ncbi:hypothetical protein O3M35_010001 [Rhynocoris fuscipes]|uniref:4a-hydroxytetrahydrobiopterin dehydratase n=1 Tax=Rhynocoris fuscipes TaxID=488301 RepID=A0AAW1CXQ8_9HEMI
MTEKIHCIKTKPVIDEKFEDDMIKKAFTTNQEYGLWSFDKILKNKNWFRVTNKFPQSSSYMSRFNESWTLSHGSTR